MINLFHWHATHRLGANGWGSNSTFSKAWFKTISTRTCLFLHFPSSSKLRSISAVRRSLSWCFEPSQPQRMTSGLNTNFILSPGYSFYKSLHQKSYAFFSFFFSLFICCAGTQHGNLHPARWPILFCGSTQEPVLAAANTRKKTWERFWKNCRWMDRKGKN